MIRPARNVDIPRLVAILKEATEASIYAGVDEVDEAHTKQLLVNLIARHGRSNAVATWAAVSENDGQVEGVLAGMLDRVQGIGKRFFATDLFFVGTKAMPARDATALLAGFESWAWSIPDVIEIHHGFTNVVGSFKRTERLAKRRGFIEFGAIYRKRRP